MRPQVVLSILLNIAGMLAPVLVLSYLFGSTVKVDVNDVRHLLALLGSTLVPLAIGLISGALWKTADRPAIVDALEQLAKKTTERRTESAKGRHERASVRP